MIHQVTVVHILFGVLLFYLINWIGKESYGTGYQETSLFSKVDEAPAFNFLIRVLTPIVYIIIVAALLYSFGLDSYTKNIYMVNVYYIVFRWLYNLVQERSLLLNYKRQFICNLVIITSSYFAYEKLLIKKENILPDLETVANELWITS